jgi:hypothetical protein
MAGSSSTAQEHCCLGCSWRLCGLIQAAWAFLKVGLERLADLIDSQMIYN